MPDRRVGHQAGDGVAEPAGKTPAWPATAAGRGAAGHVRHYLRSLSYPGLTCGWLFFVLSLTPSLLPRSWQAQGVVSGSAVAQGYGLGVAIAWAARRSGIPRLSGRIMRRAGYTLLALVLFTVPAALWMSSVWQGEVRRAVGVAAGESYWQFAVLLIAIGVAVAAIGLVRLVHDAYRALDARLLRRHVPDLLARLVATAVVVSSTAFLMTGMSDQVLLRAADTAYSSVNDGDRPGVIQPSSPLRSGSAASHAAWETLGRQGRAFVASGPTTAEIEEFTGSRAVEPIRVYAGLRSAPTLQGEADLVLRELKRTGAFRREILAVVLPTGTGWIPIDLVAPVEYMYGGDTAVAAIQYSYLPSWISFLTQRPRAVRAGQVLFDTIYDHWASLPDSDRPRLVVAGESLGAYGLEAAFSDLADITARASAALFVGPPNDTKVWRELTAERETGSPEWLPVYRDGCSVRFASSASDLLRPGCALGHPRVVYLQHATDPIVWWSTDLAFRKPAWLTGPRGPDVSPQMRWFPLVTFWQVTADLIVSTEVPAGHGHHYSPEIPAAWAAILQPPGWTDNDAGRLSALSEYDELPP